MQPKAKYLEFMVFDARHTSYLSFWVYQHHHGVSWHTKTLTIIWSTFAHKILRQRDSSFPVDWSWQSCSVLDSWRLILSHLHFEKLSKLDLVLLFFNCHDGSSHTKRIHHNLINFKTLHWDRGMHQSQSAETQCWILGAWYCLTCTLKSWAS